MKTGLNTQIWCTQVSWLKNTQHGVGRPALFPSTKLNSHWEVRIRSAIFIVLILRVNKLVLLYCKLSFQYQCAKFCFTIL